MLDLNIQNTFIKELPADPNRANLPRQVFGACYSFVEPKKTSKPELILSSEEVALSLGLSQNQIFSPEFLNVISGNKVEENTHPYAMCYGGHQFGQWAGQLGDGRAINLFEVNHEGKQWAIQLKGAGPTPYSRRADGLAVLRSSIREFLCSEAMHHLGVPTTRALSLVLSGDEVLRDIMYDGNADYEPGAIVCRVAPSFLRFGSFEIFASRNDNASLKVLLDYTINNFYTHLGVPSKETYVQFFKELTQKTLEMVLHWQRVGFVHGVMNTDNFSILGLTIDYGPFGWLDDYNHDWTPNTTDAQTKRYRYGMQPNIALWNLIQLANAIYPLIEDAEPFTEILKDYQKGFGTKYLQMMKQKLGIYKIENTDRQLVFDLEKLLQLAEVDMTIFFRLLGDLKTQKTTEKEFVQFAFDILKRAFYNIENLNSNLHSKWENWFKSYYLRLNFEDQSDLERKEQMDLINPKFVLRNYMAQLAIEDAEEGKYELLQELFVVLKNPYSEQPEFEKWFSKRPDWARNKVGCSKLSCSS